jgi:hypothetical protein
VTHAGIAAHHQPGAGHQCGEVRDAGTPGEHRVRPEPGGAGHARGQRPFGHGTGHHHVVPGRDQPAGHLREPAWRPAPGRGLRTRVQHGHPARHRVRRRHPQREIVRIRLDAVPVEQPAPPRHLVLLVGPPRTVPVPGGAARERQQPAGQGGLQQPVGLRPAPVQVHREPGRRQVPRPGGQVVHGDEPVHRVGELDQRREPGGRRQRQLLPGEGAPQPA